MKSALIIRSQQGGAFVAKGIRIAVPAPAIPRVHLSRDRGVAVILAGQRGLPGPGPELPTATDSVLGGIKASDSVLVADDGTASVSPDATAFDVDITLIYRTAKL